MEKYDLGDPGPHIPIGISDIERDIHDATNEIIREITALQLEIEEQRWWRLAVFVLLCVILWKLW